MANIIYKVFRGDELLKIDSEKYTVQNLYHSDFNQRIHGTIILIKEDGVFVDEDNTQKPVSAGDCIICNYNYSVIVKSPDLYKTIEAEIAKQTERNKECCVSEAKCVSN